MANRVYEWVDERTGIKPALDYVLYRRIPKSVNWFFTLGSASLTVFIVQVLSGSFLAMNYTPSTAVVTRPDGVISNEALESVRNLTYNIPLGDWVRGFHHWGANIMVIVVVMHMLRVFFMGSYKYPRELTWFLGVLILIMVLGFSFTGYLLPWDNRAYWATQVGVNIAGAAPFLGEAVKTALVGGPTLGAATLTRFYAIHVLLLPAITAGLIGAHLFLIIKIGISGMPAATRKENNGNGELFDTAALQQKKKGRAFFPYIIFKDAVVSLIVVAAIVILTIASPVETTRSYSSTTSNTLDINVPVSLVEEKTGEVKTIDNKAYDPSADNGEKISPQPEWYFMFLFQFLKLFPTEVDLGLFKISGEAIGGILIPTFAFILLFAVPILDRGPKRNPINRPITTGIMATVFVGMALLTFFAYQDVAAAQKPVPTGGAASGSSGGNSGATTTPAATTAASGATTPAANSGGAGDATAGLAVFQANCTGCHKNDGKAAGIGPKLQAYSELQGKDAAFIKGVVKNGYNKMQAVEGVDGADLDNVAAYVLSLQK